LPAAKSCPKIAPMGAPTRGFVVAAALLLAACGARSSMGVGGSGGAPSNGDAASAGGGAGASPIGDAGAQEPDAGPGCVLDDLATWRTERYRDSGDYERAAVALRGVPWVALKPRNGDIVLAELGVDAAEGIVLRHPVEIPDSPVYPVALDVDDRRFVLLTTSGVNWNGDVELWRIDREGGGILRVPVGDPPADPAFTVGSTLGLAGDDVVLAYSRLADDSGTVELRDDQLQIIQSQHVGGSSFTGVWSSAGVDVYVGATSRVHAAAGVLTETSVDPGWPVIGGLEGYLVGMGSTIRLTEGAHVWSAEWPHSQISTPAVVRTDGDRAAFALETELTAVVGHVRGESLEWLRIEGAEGAPGTGVRLLPVVEQGRLGLFYLGLEVPHPEQPLRYYGLACP
jgi:hypothetical protein